MQIFSDIDKFIDAYYPDGFDDEVYSRKNYNSILGKNGNLIIFDETNFCSYQNKDKCKCACRCECEKLYKNFTRTNKLEHILKSQ